MKRISGLGLIETLLVLAIAGILLYAGIRQYQIYKFDGDVFLLRKDVATVFQAMEFFYRSECGFSEVAKSYGLLHPLNQDNPPPASGDSYSLTLDELKTRGFLATSELPNPLISPPNENSPAYVVQFNRYDSQRADGNGTIVTWTAQVAVHIAGLSDQLDENDLSKAQKLLKLTNGDCLSKLDNKLIIPCTRDNATTEGDYIVWERLPSRASLTTTAWIALPLVKQFNQQYMVNPNVPQDNYFVCGS